MVGLTGLRTWLHALIGIAQTPVTSSHKPDKGNEGRGIASLLSDTTEASQTASIPSFTLSSSGAPNRARLRRLLGSALASSTFSSSSRRGPRKRVEDAEVTGRVSKWTVASSRFKKE